MGVTWWFTLGLPLFLSLCAYVVHQHVTAPYPAVRYSLKSPAPLTFNSRLQSAAVHSSPLLSGPETVAVHPTDSSLWTGCYDGSLVRLTTESESGFEAQLVSFSGWAAVNGSVGFHSVNVTAACLSAHNPWMCGRPLGLLFRSSDELLVADAYHGLLSYSLGSGVWRSLWNDSGRDTNSVALDSSGDVLYFTSASALYRNHEVLYDCSSGQCTGSVWRYDFITGTARLLHDELCFANGILVREQRLLVAETTTGRILSLPLDDTAQRSVVIDSDRLPCLPDNLHFDKRSTSYYWVGCGSPIRTAGKFDLYDTLGAMPVVRQLMVYLLPYKLIDSLIDAQAMVIRLQVVNDSWHEVSDVLIDPDGTRLQSTTSAVWRANDDRLWFTSFRPVTTSLHNSTPHQPFELCR